ncbi:MAG: hypothetical protein AB7U85_07475 [Alphaproteobacteria bacterium]
MKNKITYFFWVSKGKPNPPHHIIKQKKILRLQKRQGNNVFVETGTYFGDMVFAVKDTFKQIYTVELSKDLYDLAVERFKKDTHINLLNGDSGEVLKDLVKKIEEPAIFWLDGHYSGGETAKGNVDTPIVEELKHIFSSELKHTILIDDARCFGKNDGYPTIEELEKIVLESRQGAKIKVESDIIEITY